MMNSCEHNEQGGVIVSGLGVLCGSCAFRAKAKRRREAPDLLGALEKSLQEARARREAAKASYTAFKQLHDWVEEQDLFVDKANEV